MLCQAATRTLAHFLAPLGFVLVLVVPRSMPAAEPNDQLLHAHLAAGEFGPARDLALGQADGRLRDRWLGEVAAAQAQLGSRHASLSTASQIGDDRVRGTTLGAIGRGPIQTWPARGGGAQADFDSLIELITSTVAPQSWDLVGGPGAVNGFEGGVYVDSVGLLKRLPTVADPSLAQLHRQASRWGDNQNARKPSVLRKVSLTRLEKQAQLLWAQGKDPSQEMQLLAGMTRVKYVLMYPDTGDVVLAGPAGNWTRDAEGRTVNSQTGEPVLQLDDLVVLLRNAMDKQGRFGCSITPTKEGLARTKAFLSKSSMKPIRPSQRDKWLADLRATLGKQNIEVYGFDARTRAAHVLVEADYRMKLVGMGLEDGTLGVTSYLNAIAEVKGQKPPPMDVLRWWFTLNYQALRATPDRRAFALQGPGVKVLSENELVTDLGQRVHTGTSDELNLQFARSFTRQFERLAAKYPIYAELRNVFDLALVAAVIHSEDLAGQTDWHLTHFRNPEGYRVQLEVVPTQVDSVINHRVLNRTHIVAGVSGGVSVDTSKLVARSAIRTDDYGVLKAEYSGSMPKQLPVNAWWWD